MKLIYSLLLYFFMASFSSQAQAEKEALDKLSFMIGNWKGTSFSFSEKETKTTEVTEDVTYKMNGSLLVLDVKSSWIELHTIITYNSKEQCYYYHPFSKAGLRDKYKGNFEDNVFRVYFTKERRITFTLTKEGYFHEYGENLKNGSWEKYFEDILQPVK
ncbi:hypothetical protein EV195_101759 [Tenacibaculum skagerrakense]|uniref:DUF1579 domain-containing protein n=1 Tax=Tenacibaculum skagerrakense TaxID=186571 RepID=A0A4R2P1L0_9FLAO|nr:hypothetical protein [Tenacibaculum skagerrakense]TCP28579.1 hypothetical protein EV195_101759 [Tenacibaculum skagerrakense]